MATEGQPATARKGDFVQVHIVVIEPDSRAQNLPEATRRVPYEGWVKGFLLDDQARLGDAVRIESLIGREITGILSAMCPTYDHGFGVPQAELDSIGLVAWRQLEGGGAAS